MRYTVLFVSAPGMNHCAGAYPFYARYDGSGSLEDAANFVCSVN
jgi:hypothetical protein